MRDSIRKVGKSKKVLAVLLSVLMVLSVFQVQRAEAVSHKNIIIAQMKGNTVSYYKLIGSSELIPDSPIGNLIGYGKKKKIKIASNAEYYCLSPYGKKVKVSKKKFKKNLNGSSKNNWKGTIYYTGMACRVTIKNGKCVKFVQLYQA